MKTKVIYISGGETFAPEQIRAAFDEIRDNLGIDSDVVMFGVPIDSNTAAAKEIVTEVAHTTQEIKKVKVQNTQSQVKKSPPILSVITATASPVIESEPIAEEIPESVAARFDDSATLDDAPMAQSIEDLFDDLVPVAEDVKVDISKDDLDNIKMTSAEVELFDSDDADPTLSQLATEFANTDTDILDKKQKISRVGKLRTPLPFKNKKDSAASRLGDLFGWAGVAANDDDGFDMPGFFKVAP